MLAERVCWSMESHAVDRLLQRVHLQLFRMPRLYEWILRLYDTPLGPQGERETELLAELKALFSKLIESTNTSGSSSEQVWVGFVNQLRQRMLHDDPREFLRWDVTRVALSDRNQPCLLEELNYLKQGPGWKTRWQNAIQESPTGHPIPLIFYPMSSSLLLHHTYGLAIFESYVGQRVEAMDFIFEFGGGYGSMCRLVHRVGFKGKYLIFDLPSQCALQRYFLQSQNILTHSSLDTFRRAASGVLSISDQNLLQEILDALPSSGRSLFTATWSISETPVAFREKFLDLVNAFDWYWIAYQSTFREVDNDKFFQDWKEAQANLIWHTVPLRHRPGNYYLIGAKSEKPCV